MKSWWRISIFRFVLVAAVTLVLVACGQSQTASSPSGSPWTQVWSDEFSGSNGSAPDSSKWTIETGGDGWGNHELEYYTNRPQNAQIQNGSLVITALKETYTGTGGVTPFPGWYTPPPVPPPDPGPRPDPEPGPMPVPAPLPAPPDVPVPCDGVGGPGSRMPGAVFTRLTPCLEGTRVPPIATRSSARRCTRRSPSECRRR
jgi:hypothetical protein